MAHSVRPVILVVEDELLIMMDAIDTLHDAGFDTVEATSAAAATEILTLRPDIAAVFTDVQIVGEPNGLELAHKIRDKWPPIALIITSGLVSPRQEELPTGGFFLPKPYTREGLVARVKSALPPLSNAVVDA